MNGNGSNLKWERKMLCKEVNGTWNGDTGNELKLIFEKEIINNITGTINKIKIILLKESFSKLLKIKSFLINWIEKLFKNVLFESGGIYWVKMIVIVLVETNKNLKKWPSDEWTGQMMVDFDRTQAK